jgi:outer membrane protein assembly factor BamB
MRWLLIGVLALLVAVVALYQFVGLRISLDGSGMMPRFVGAAPDYDALEEHRARQHELPPVEPEPLAPPPPTVPAVLPAEPAVDPVRARPARVDDKEWADFRGPKRDGRYEGPVRVEWPSDGLPLLWKQPIGEGYASFVAGQGRVFTIEQRRNEEVVSAYDAATGREVWTVGWPGRFSETMGGDGPRATPTYHDGRVYALGAMGAFAAIDASTGTTVWRGNILEDAGADNLDWGMSGAPLIVDDKVVVLPGGRSGKSVVAYERSTGKPAWTALDDRQAYVSPMVVTLAGTRQLVVLTAARLVGLTVDEGRLLWEYPFATTNGINAAQPLLLGGDRIFLSASYGSGAAVIEVKQAAGGLSATTVWQSQRMRNKFTSSVLHEGHIYGLDEAILACLDAATGELKWKGGRYGYGQLLIAGDRLIVLTEGGDVVQVKASPDRHEEIARFPAISGKTWNHPIITRGRLLVRNGREMAAFDIGISGF